jgi:hypothetical protein
MTLETDSTTTSASPSERRFEAVVDFCDAATRANMGACMLALNKRGFVYTNSIEPIEDWETVASGTVSGTTLEAEQDIGPMINALVRPFGGECSEWRIIITAGNSEYLH